MHPKWEEADYMRRIALTLIMAALLVALSAAPALAFHHGFLPANECGQSPNAGGTTDEALNPHFTTRPLPPAGTAAVEASPVIGPAASCPAGQ